MISSKTCKDCGLEKSTSEFYRDQRARDGLENYCKPCKVQRAQARRAAQRGAGATRTPKRSVSSGSRPTYEPPWGQRTPTLVEGIESAVTVATHSTEIADALRSDGVRGEDVESISRVVWGFDDDVGGETDE